MVLTAQSPANCDPEYTFTKLDLTGSPDGNDARVRLPAAFADHRSGRNLALTPVPPDAAPSALSAPLKLTRNSTRRSALNRASAGACRPAQSKSARPDRARRSRMLDQLHFRRRARRRSASPMRPSPWIAHLGGFFSGLLLFPLFDRPYPPPPMAGELVHALRPGNVDV